MAIKDELAKGMQMLRNLTTSKPSMPSPLGASQTQSIYNQSRVINNQPTFMQNVGNFFKPQTGTLATAGRNFLQTPLPQVMQKPANSFINLTNKFEQSPLGMPGRITKSWGTTAANAAIGTGKIANLYAQGIRANNNANESLRLQQNIANQQIAKQPIPDFKYQMALANQSRNSMMDANKSDMSRQDQLKLALNTGTAGLQTALMGKGFGMGIGKVATNALVGAGLSVPLSLVTGQDVGKGVEDALTSAPTLTGLLKYSGPLTEKLLSGIGGNTAKATLGTKILKTTGRLTSAGLMNTLEDNIMSLAKSERLQNLGENAGSFVMGAGIQAGNETLPLALQTLRKNKQFIAAVKDIEDFIRINKVDLESKWENTSRKINGETYVMYDLLKKKVENVLDIAQRHIQDYQSLPRDVKEGGKVRLDLGLTGDEKVTLPDTRSGRTSKNPPQMTTNQGTMVKSGELLQSAPEPQGQIKSSAPQEPKLANQKTNTFDSSNGSIPQTKTRGFVESVGQSENVTNPTKTGVDGTYTVKPNEQLMGEAKALLNEGASIDFKNTKDLDKKVAATIQHAVNLDKAGQHEAAAALYNNLSEHATELGRGVQAFSLLDNMSPQAVALSAAGKIRKYNATHSAKIPELTGDQVKMISDKVELIRQMADGREKNIAMNELGNTISSFIPSSLADKVISVWKAGLLTSLRTHERNFIGNAIHGTMEVAKDVPATIADMAMSGKTGKRTVTFTGHGIGEFASKSTVQQMADIVSKGYDPSEQVDKFDYKKVNWGNSKLGKTLKWYTDKVFNTLGASDKPFYNAALARSLYDQAGAAAINAGKRGDKQFIEALVKAPTEEMIKIAVNDANTATFKNKNVASTVATAIKREMGKHELTKMAGEIVLPFTGVPSSILGQAQAYSPIGLVKGMFKVGRVMAGQIPEMQRQAAQELGRGVIGSGIMYLGAYLAGKGLITGQPKDAAEARQWDLENKPRNSILINGKWRSLNSIGPESIVFLAGAKLNEERNSPEGFSASKYGMGLAKDQIDQSFLTGLQAPVNAITDPQRYAKSYVGNTASSVIPNLIKDSAKATDPFQRETNTWNEYAQAGIPGLRDNLVIKRDTLGNAMKQEPTGAAAFVDLFNSKTPVKNTIVDELSRLNGTGNNSTPSKLNASQTILKQKVKLTPEQLNNLEAGAGQLVTQSLEKLVSSPSYQALPDEDKAKAIDNTVQQARKVYKAKNGQDILNTTKPTPGVVKAAEYTPSKMPSTFEKPFVVTSDTGSVKIIDLSKPINEPEYTGDSILDKKIKSKYTSEINERITDVVTLYQDKQIDLETAKKLVGELQGKYNKANPKKPKMPKAPKFSSMKLSAPKVSKSKKLGDVLRGKQKAFKLKKYTIKKRS